MCMPTGPPLHLYQILSQSVWELWPAQDFGFRGDNYKTKKVRVASLAHDTPNQSYGVHKILASGEITT